MSDKTAEDDLDLGDDFLVELPEDGVGEDQADEGGEGEEKPKGGKKPDAEGGAGESDDDSDDGGESEDEDEDVSDDDDDDSDMDARSKRKMYLARKKAREAQQRADEAERLAQERIEAAERKAEEAERRASRNLEVGVNATVETLEAQEKALRADLKKAKEEGDTEKEIELQDKWTDLKVDLISARRAADNLKSKRKDDDGEDDYDASRTRGRRDADDKGTRQKTGEKTIPKRFQKWMERNEWIQDPKRYAAEINGMSAIETELRKEGFDPNDEDFYRELDKRGAERFSRIKKYQVESQSYRGRSHVGAGDGGGAPKIEGLVRNKEGKLTYKLTNADLREMENWGLDPQDKIAREEFAKQRISRLREDAAARKNRR